MSLEILHQISCHHISQQNMVNECKHHHFLDVTYTLWVEMGLPYYLWSDIILTTTYLYNRLSSLPLRGKVLLCHLHPYVDLFSLPPHIFGCVAFVYD